MVYLRLRPIVQVQRIEPKAFVTFSPRINLEAIEGLTERYSRMTERTEHHHAGRRQEMVLKMIERGTRVQCHELVRQSATARGEAPEAGVLPAPGIAQVIVRQAARAATVAEAQRPAPIPAPPAFASIPLDPARLADQVMRTLDRRLDVHRERVTALRIGKERKR